MRGLAQGSIIDGPAEPAYVNFAESFGRRFLLTVDTEEEFDWSQPIDRERHSVDAIPALRKFQQFCEGNGIVPVYLMDYPIATSAAAVEILGEAARTGRCDIGVQLHPWVSPPLVEEVCEFNTFAGNLPPELEREKLFRLRDTIEARFGITPLIYRAGRYGTGRDTASILSEAGFAIDTSVRARFDYAYCGGPNYRGHPLAPYWIDRPGGLMELPLTTVFWGPLRQQGDWLYPRLWRVPRLRGLLSKTGMLERIPLTPEGVTAEEVIRGIDIAIDDGLPLLVFSFHSPSLAPGYTPYVRTPEELDTFYDWWRQAFAHLQQRGVRPASLSEIMSAAALA